MDKIKRTIYMYELMKERCRKNGYSENQEKAYTNIINIISNCKTEEEIMKIFKDDPSIYEEVAKALVLDKLNASLKAAKENDYKELEDIYSQRYKEVENDYKKAFETGYENKVLLFFNKHSKKIRIFMDIFYSYILYKGSHPEEKNLEKIKELCIELENMEVSFKKLTQIDEFRKCIDLKDSEYNEYVKDVEVLINTKFDNSDFNSVVNNKFEKAWESLKDKETFMKEIGLSELKNTYRASFLVVSPEDENGKYEFINEEREDM